MLSLMSSSNDNNECDASSSSCSIGDVDPSSLSAEKNDGGASSSTTTITTNNNPILLSAIEMLPGSIREYWLETLTNTSIVRTSVSTINIFLRHANVPTKSLLTHEEFVLSWTAAIMTLLGYYLFFGKRHVRKRKKLTEDLRAAQRQVHFLHEELMKAKREDIMANTPPRLRTRSISLTADNRTSSSSSNAGVSSSSSSASSSSDREIRIFMDGAFDVMHYGHMNAFRLGKSLGTHLIVGVNSDTSITQCKGPPLMNDTERLTMVESCKFVDMVLPNCPYIMTPEYLDYIFTTYDVDYVVHGDDPCIVDGKDVYGSAKRRGRYRSIPRTEGVSTTDIVGRMLLMTMDHHLQSPKSSKRKLHHARSNSVSSINTSGRNLLLDIDDDDDDDSDTNERGDNVDIEDDNVSVMSAVNLKKQPTGVYLGHQSKFLTTSMMLRLFSADVKPPEPGMKVIYVDGAWDMFHCGHVEFLKACKGRGDYVIVGIHGDSVVNKRRGGNLPLMNLHERLLSVLGCKFMDDVLIDAPLEVTPDMIASLHITEVVHGTESDHNHAASSSDNNYFDDRYRYPKEMGIYTTIQSPSEFKLEHIVGRIQKKHVELQAKIDKKKKAEREWFENKYQNNNNGGGGEMKNGTSG